MFASTANATMRIAPSSRRRENFLLREAAAVISLPTVATSQPGTPNSAGRRRRSLSLGSPNSSHATALQSTTTPVSSLSKMASSAPSTMARRRWSLASKSSFAFPPTTTWVGFMAPCACRRNSWFSRRSLSFSARRRFSSSPIRGIILPIGNEAAIPLLYQVA
jgi:hypothetical protein